MAAESSDAAGAGGVRALVAAVGQPWLSDEAFGLRVLDRLRETGVPPGVVLADLGCGTVPAFQMLQALAAPRVILVAAVARGRARGCLHWQRVPDVLPPEAEIQARIADGVMGLVSVDNLVVMGRFYGVLPPDALQLEVEPVHADWGDTLSETVAPLVEQAAAMIEAVLGSRAQPAAGVPLAAVPAGNAPDPGVDAGLVAGDTPPASFE